MIQFYKANAKVSGTACSFSVNPKDKSVYASLIKQKSWDANSKTGRFDLLESKKPKNIVCKLTITKKFIYGYNRKRKQYTP